MSHVFISYARVDEAAAKMIADSLREDGFAVWRDDELPAHRPYAEVIEERVQGARAVVALWSSQAAKSQWVRAEADTARSPPAWSNSPARKPAARRPSGNRRAPCRSACFPSRT